VTKEQFDVVRIDLFAEKIYGGGVPETMGMEAFDFGLFADRFHDAIQPLVGKSLAEESPVLRDDEGTVSR
jgi:hypothetical protein